MPIFPATIEIKHYIYTGSSDDAHGNPTPTYADPVTRYIIGIQQLGDGRVDPISVDYEQRTITDLIIQVPDPSLYKKLDNIGVNNTVEWLLYEVQGKPVSWSDGLPWQRYAPIFGGTLHVRRVE